MFTNIPVNCEMFLVPARCIGLLAGWSLHPHFGFLSLRFYSSTKNPPYPPPPHTEYQCKDAEIVSLYISQ
jgi:hypothetical protein